MEYKELPMGIEEKAKAYDGLIERLKDLKFAYRFSPLSDTIEEKFPEIKESDDERIRKALVKYFTSSISNPDYKICGVPFKKVLAWLEMKTPEESLGIDSDTYNKIVDECIYGEQKPADKVEPKFKAGDNIISTISNIPYYITEVCNGHYLTDVGCIIMFNAQNNFELVGQKPAENKGMNLVEEEMTPFQKKVFCIIDTTIEEEQGLKQVCDELFALASNEIEQKPAEWSEQDKKILNYLLWFYDTRFRWNDTCSDDIKFGDIVTFLKSLKNRVQPQSQWKPSDEQMRVLDLAIRCGINRGTTEETTLVSLFNDLKKLIKL